jgi:hypothetical protein
MKRHRYNAPDRAKAMTSQNAKATGASAETSAGGLELVFYNDIQLAPSVENPKRLVFAAAPGAPKPPDELRMLRQDYERTARVAAVLFEDESEMRKEIFLLLHQSADRGLRGPHFSIEDGRANLIEARETILDLSHKVRDKRLKDYTRLLVIYGVTPLLLGAMIFLTNGFGWLNHPLPNYPFEPLFVCILAALWIPAGAAMCVWGEFALRMQSGLSYEELLNLDPSRWRPGQRLLITVGIAFIFAFLLAFDAIQVGVGSLLLNDFSKKTPAMALAVGGITGLAFAAVQDIIFRIRPTIK